MQLGKTANPLDDNSLKYFAPSIFALTPFNKMSEHYKFIPTIEVVDIMRNTGFLPVLAKQSKSRIEGKGEFTKHLIRFRHKDLMGMNLVGEEVPEIVLVNSHDGTSSYQLNAGVYRLACSNGMVVKSNNLESIAIRHSGKSDLKDKVIDATYTIVNEVPALFSKIEQWKNTQLTNTETTVLAEAAKQLKDNTAITSDKLLEARRASDRPNDLWTVFNRIQENLMKGGLTGFRTNDQGRIRRVSTRPIKSVTEDLRINKALWKITEHFAASKASQLN